MDETVQTTKTMNVLPVNVNDEFENVHLEKKKNIEQRFVIKRKGSIEVFNDTKIKERIESLSEDLVIDIDLILGKLVSQLRKQNQKTSEIDELAAEICAALCLEHPDYTKLAGRILISNLHKETPATFSESMEIINDKLKLKGRDVGFFSDEFMASVRKNAHVLDAKINHEKDYELEYFAVKTLMASYLHKDTNGKVLERPQYLLMRTALNTYPKQINKAKKLYDLYSSRKLSAASPTLFNSGKPNPQLASCFLLVVSDDSIDGIYTTLRQCALISKNGGGIGVSFNPVRSRGSYIGSSGHESSGIVNALKVFNMSASYVDQGRNRKGAWATYIEPWHNDIFEFLDLRKNHGAEEERARLLFYGLWVPDLFMKRVEANDKWSLFSPNHVPKLNETYGEEFEKYYIEYENMGLAVRTVKARDVMASIVDTLIQTSMPYILFKDACNNKSNFKNTALIQSSNLCAEVLLPASKDEVAVCNLASVSIKEFVDMEKKTVDHKGIMETSYHAAETVNRIIDITYYPVPEAKTSNLKHRPIGIGIRGLEEARLMLGYTPESKEFAQLNRDVMEDMYYGALLKSMELSKRYGPYKSFQGSPTSQGILQFDLWGVTPSDRWPWEQLKKDIVTHGLRNSQLIALMPTASTSQITNASESFEFYISNVFVRRTLAGEFVVINEYLVRDLLKLGLWNTAMKNKILAHDGSIQHIDEIPQHLKDIYKIGWEISNKTVIDLAAIRAPFVCQTQSMNLFLEKPKDDSVTSMIFYAWRKGLKTGLYYLRRKAAADPIKFTINPDILKNVKKENRKLTKSNIVVQSTGLDGVCVGCQ